MFNENIATERRIRHPKKYEELFTQLTTGNEAIFESKAQLLLFAASIGSKEGKRTSFTDKESFEPIRIATFENLGRIFPLVFDSIAIADSDDIKILSDACFDDRALIFEEYACTGLEILQNMIADPSQRPFDTILGFVKKELAPQQTGTTVDVLQYFEEISKHE